MRRGGSRPEDEGAPAITAIAADRRAAVELQEVARTQAGRVPPRGVDRGPLPHPREHPQVAELREHLGCPRRRGDTLEEVGTDVGEQLAGTHHGAHILHPVLGQAGGGGQPSHLEGLLDRSHPIEQIRGINPLDIRSHPSHPLQGGVRDVLQVGPDPSAGDPELVQCGAQQVVDVLDPPLGRTTWLWAWVGLDAREPPGLNPHGIGVHLAVDGSGTSPNLLCIPDNQVRVWTIDGEHGEDGSVHPPPGAEEVADVSGRVEHVGGRDRDIPADPRILESASDIGADLMSDRSRRDKLVHSRDTADPGV